MARALEGCAGELRRLIRTDPDPRVRQRAQVVLLLAQGESVLGVARLFTTAPHRVRQWRTRYMERGRTGLADAPRTGRPPKLAVADLALLDEALERGPQAYGWPVTVWSVRDLRELLWQQHGVRVSVPTLYRAVRGLGYRYRRPRHDLRHRQDREAVASAREVLAWLGKAPPPGSSTWSTPMSAKFTLPPSHPRLAKVWRRRGCALRVPAAGEDKKFAVFGGLDYASGRVVWRTSATKDGASFVRFLDDLAAALPEGQVVVVLDNVGYHKSHVVRRWWVTHRERVRPLWLPAYAPELNPIERVWRHVKDKLSNHRWWADLPALERATSALLDRIDARFHRPEGITIAPVQNFCEAA